MKAIKSLGRRLSLAKSSPSSSPSTSPTSPKKSNGLSASPSTTTSTTIAVSEAPLIPKPLQEVPVIHEIDPSKILSVTDAETTAPATSPETPAISSTTPAVEPAAKPVPAAAAPAIATATSTAITVPLNQGWTFARQAVENEPALPFPADEWIDASVFPTNVHSELLKLGKIPDPFIGLNEYDVQWIGETAWAFKTSFEVESKVLDEPNVDLVFEGLDTYASVYLNGDLILEATNMFLEYRVPVKSHLKTDTNELLIQFPSTFHKGLELEEQNGKKQVWNGNSSRLHVRKAQYHYGWDWGPNIMTVGPWKPIFLHAYTAHIADAHIKTVLSEALDSATLNISLDVSGAELASEGLGAVVTVLKPDGTVAVTQTASLSTTETSGVLKSKLDIELAKDDIQLWYPIGYGAQPVYTVNVEVKQKSESTSEEASSSTLPLAHKAQRIGLRTVRVVQDPLEGQEGLSFLFEVNGVRIFAGGSNWYAIPADSFLTELPAERYVDWLKLMVQGNQNMIRIWGGGIYEPDVFYDTCDELGIMVWQDFMFACGQYPAYDAFVESVKSEAEQAVKRLRHHPSLVIWAGNNEDYMMAEILKLPIDWSLTSLSESELKASALPARHIYETVLPEVVNRIGNGDVYYHRSSPYSIPGKSSMDLKHGDLHNWNVWHGEQLDYQKWEYMSARFVSEFGMQAFPDRRTVDHWLGGNTAERSPQSRTSVSHNKSTGHEKRLAQYLIDNFPYSMDMDGYIYATQLLQSEAVSSAYRVWRRNWKGRGKEYNAGVLVWQLNDCWPVTSWALVDYFLRPKPAFFTIARELRPLTVGIARYEKKGPVPKSSAEASQFFVAVWATNATLEANTVSLELAAFDLYDPTFQWSQKKDITLPPNSSTDLMMMPLPGQPPLSKKSQVPRGIVVHAKLLDKDGDVISRNTNWPEPFKFINFPPPSAISLKVTSTSPPGATQITLSAARPVKGIILDAEGDADVKWSDQAIDLVPGDDQIVLAWGLGKREVKVRYLGDGVVE
ncbi:glycoside hydrolase [Clavulina sp. PMI_390]|nr:glycoside hydrolase [Clavulina sp. PMI_390]